MSTSSALSRLPAADKPDWLSAALAVGLVGAGVLLLVFDGDLLAILPGCPLFTATGFYCPGCGSTRALHALLHGRPGQALGFNPLAVISLPLLMMWLWARLLGPGGSRITAYPDRLSPHAIWILILLFWVLRNLDGYPFNLLAP